MAKRRVRGGWRGFQSFVKILMKSLQFFQLCFTLLPFSNFFKNICRGSVDNLHKNLENLRNMNFTLVPPCDAVKT